MTNERLAVRPPRTYKPGRRWVGWAVIVGALLVVGGFVAYGRASAETSAPTAVIPATQVLRLELSGCETDWTIDVTLVDPNTWAAVFILQGDHNNFAPDETLDSAVRSFTYKLKLSIRDYPVTVEYFTGASTTKQVLKLAPYDFCNGGTVLVPLVFPAMLPATE